MSLERRAEKWIPVFGKSDATLNKRARSTTQKTLWALNLF